ncbi:MAG: TetR/AcrR family transcriptional regulator [Proteobacteria bacterium]|nr:TetR/AcrR family transcriptional regulator [Pseudomonadota bacterium]MBU1710504.1 TetR/AcrR family transcriptional regulator [Pseudomonadota bacterium]
MDSTILINEKNTFRNLPEDKRWRIIDAAVHEFARNGYQGASLNNIVRQLGIAKGSLYQYFKNKEAIFLFIFERFTNLVRLAVKDAPSNPAPDNFFTMVKRVLCAGIRFIDQHPDYYQIYLKVLFEPGVPNREELISQVRLFSQEYFGPLCQRAKDLGEIRSDLDDQTAVFVIDAIMDRFLQGYAQSYLDGGLGFSKISARQLEAKIDALIKVLQDGLSPS